VSAPLPRLLPLMSLPEAVATLDRALDEAAAGQVFVPRAALVSLLKAIELHGLSLPEAEACLALINIATQSPGVSRMVVPTAPLSELLSAARRSGGGAH
jgi:hypothetical protein